MCSFQNDEYSSLTVERAGKFTVNSNHDLHINHLYSGSENNLTLSRIYSSDFLCTFDMTFYPFDTQECNMTFTLPVWNSCL